MSKQFNFYMTPNDNAKIDQMLFEKIPDFTLIKYQMKTNELIFTNSSARESGEWGRFCAFQGKNVRLIKTKYIETQNYFLIDDFRSLAIEYSTCYYDDSDISRGRMYFNTAALRSEFPNEFADFEVFARKVYNLVKKNLKLVDLWYYGPEALKLYEEKSRLFR